MCWHADVAHCDVHMQVRDPLGPPADTAEPVAHRLGGAMHGASAAANAAAAAQQRLHQAQAARTAAAAAPPPAPPPAQGVMDVATAYEQPADPRTEQEEAALAAMGGTDTGTAVLQLQREASQTSQERPQAAGAASGEQQPAETSQHNALYSDAEAAQALPARASADGNASDVHDATPPQGARPPVDAMISNSKQAKGAQQDIAGHAHDAQTEQSARAAQPRAQAADVDMVPANPGHTDHDANAQSFAEGLVSDDASLNRAREVQAALDGIFQGGVTQAQLTALRTVATIVGNALAHTEEDKFRHVRRSNKVFASRVVPRPEIELLLQLAGFALSQEGTWSLGKRSDPAMLWLVHSFLQSRCGDDAVGASAA